MTTVAAPARRVDVGGVVRLTFRSVRRNFAPFFLLSLLLGVAPRVWLEWASDALGFANLAVGALSLLAGWLTQATIVSGVVADLGGGRMTFRECLAAGLERLLPLSGLALVVTVGVLLAGVFLVVPAIVLTVWWIAAVPALVVERRGVWASLGRSARLTKGHRWTVLVLIVVFLLVSLLLLLGMLFGAAVVESAVGDELGEPLIRFGVGPAVLAVLGVVTSAAVGATYHELRAAKEGVGETLATVFD